MLGKNKQEFSVIVTYRGEANLFGQRRQFEKKGSTIEEYELTVPLTNCANCLWHDPVDK